MTGTSGPKGFADVDTHAVARRGDVGVMSLLLDNGLDPDLRDGRGFSLIMIAAYAGQTEMVRLLADRGADPDLRDAAGNTPLMGACFKGSVDVARALLDAGADASARNGEGRTALHFASELGHEALVDLLSGGRT